MEKRNHYYKTVLWMLTGVFLLTGCSDNHGTAEGVLSEEKAAFQRESVSPEVERILTEAEEDEPEAASLEVEKEEITEGVTGTPEIIEADWSDFFDGLNGAAVLYDEADRQYTICNSELATTRRSPCSTFKIISSLVALENVNGQGGGRGG